MKKEIKNLRFYPTKVLIRFWKNREITSEELKRLVKKEYLPMELQQEEF